MDVVGYSARAEAFASTLAWHHYRRFAGLAADVPLGSLYLREADLFTADAVRRLRAEGERATGPALRRRLGALLRFAAEGHLAAGTAELEAELGRREGAMRLPGPDGVPIALGDVPRALAGEEDADRRAALEAERVQAIGRTLAPLAIELTELRQARARSLGWTSYAAMYEQLTGIDLQALGAQAERFLAATEQPLAAAGRAARETLGRDPDEVRRGDLPRLLRQPVPEARFPVDGLPDALHDALGGLGLRLAGGGPVTLDLVSRAGKSRRPFCAPVRVPEEIYLVLAATGGWEDYAALLHESGHAMHFASAGADLDHEARRLGDAAVGEAFAFLFERIADEPAWLEARGVDGAACLPSARWRRLLFLRRYAAKLGFELELHGGEGAVADAGPRYADRLSVATGVRWPAQSWLTDLDPGLYTAHYLRAWALESGLRSALRDRFGPSWFHSPEAGHTLAGWWRDSHGLRAEELLSRVGERGELDLAELAGEFDQALPANQSRAAASSAPA